MLFLNLSQGLEPSSPLGICLLFIGLIFSSGCLYVMSNHNHDSIEDQKRKIALEEERAYKISRLYPNKQ